MVRTSPSDAGGTNLIPALGAKIPHVLLPKGKKKKSINIKPKQYGNKFNKDFKKYIHR